MTWLAALLPSVIGLAGNKPWQADPTQDTAPQVERPDYTGVMIVGVVGIALIILMIVILSKKV